MTTSKSTLYIPPINPDEVIWSGLPMTASEALEEFDVDEVKYTAEVNSHLTSLGANSKTVFAIENQVSDSITFLGFDAKNFSILKEAIEICRVVKDEYEVALIRKANVISAVGHHAAMAKVSSAKNETELEALYGERCVSLGAKRQAYHPIFASGRAAATLHYVRNDQPIKGKLNLLVDAGAEWNCYAADIVSAMDTVCKVESLTYMRYRPILTQVYSRQEPILYQENSLQSLARFTISF
jgi:Xaa-Pro dipeptidase